MDLEDLEIDIYLECDITFELFVVTEIEQLNRDSRVVGS
jgi:hypothetical protein